MEKITMMMAEKAARELGVDPKTIKAVADSIEAFDTPIMKAIAHKFFGNLNQLFEDEVIGKIILNATEEEKVKLFNFLEKFIVFNRETFINYPKKVKKSEKLKE